MPHPRTIVGLCGLLLVIVAWGCSGADDEAQSNASNTQAAALVPVDVARLEVSSPVFTEIRPRKRIPKESTCYGINSSPPLDWSEVPVGAKSLVLIVEEPDERLSDKSNYFKVTLSGDAVHWLLYNIPHEFYFRLYALDEVVELTPGATATELTDAMEGHILGYGETLGKFQVPRQQGWFVGDTGTPVSNTPTPMP